MQEKRLLSSVTAALSHPYGELRQQAVGQMLSLGLSIGSVAKHLTAEIKSGGSGGVRNSWFLLQVPTQHPQHPHPTLCDP